MFPLGLILFCSVFWWFLEGFDDQGRGKKYYPNQWTKEYHSLSYMWLTKLNKTYCTHTYTHKRKKVPPPFGPVCVLSPCNHLLLLAMSSPVFWGDRPQGPILGASTNVAPTSPPVHLRCTILIALGSNLNSRVEAASARWSQIWDEPGSCTGPP